MHSNILQHQLAYLSNCFFGIIQITFHRNRMSCCKQCNQKQLRYKVLQSDLQFQIKKMSEDLASEKVTLQLQYQKQSKKSIEKYNKERLEREEENRRWLQKYDQIVQEYERRISAMQRDYGLREKEIEQSETSKYSKKEQQIRNNYSASLNKLENSYQNTIQQLQDKFQQECLRAKLQKEEEISRLNKKHEEHTSGVVADYDVRIRQLKQEIKTGLDNIDRLKIQSHQKQTLLYEELYQRKQEISDLKYNVDQLKTNITILQEEIRHKNLEIEVIKEQHEQKLAQLEQSFESQKESIVSSFSQQIEDLLKDKLQDCQKFEQVVKDIQVKRENQIKIYETNLKEVKEFVEERPSREQDLEKINNLKELLLQKEKEFQKAFNEAKGYRLELNNKEEIFTKIFCSHSPLNIEKIGKKKEYKFPRTSSSTLKDMSKYHSVNTFHTLPAASDLTKKEKLVLQPKSTKFF